MTKVFVGAACAASASAAVATLTMNLALRQNTLKKEKREEKKPTENPVFCQGMVNWFRVVGVSQRQSVDVIKSAFVAKKQ